MKDKIRIGWGLLIKGKVREVHIGRKKPHHEVFYDGEYHSKIIPVKIIY